MRYILTQRFLPVIFLLIPLLATAQTPPACPSNNTLAADLCPDICIYCNLSGYTGSTLGYTGQTPVGGFCGTIENEQWLGFVAGATIAEITVLPFNCTDGNGMQVALYTGCDSAPVDCFIGSPGGAGIPASISVDLVPGTIYYMLIDSYAGDQCDFTLSVSPPGAILQGEIISQEVALCPGSTFLYEGIEYTAPGVVIDTLTDAGACDSVLVINLVESPLNDVMQTVQFCPGESVVINGVTFTEPGIYVYTITATTGGCDTTVTTLLEWLPQPVRSDTLVLQPGESVVIGGNTYFAPGIVTDTLPSASGGCDTAVTYTLLLDPTIPDTCLLAKSFFKKIGEQGVYETGTAICTAADGNLYIAGEKGEKSLLMKVTPSGVVLWSRTFAPSLP